MRAQVRRRWVGLGGSGSDGHGGVVAGGLALVLSAVLGFGIGGGAWAAEPADVEEATGEVPLGGVATEGAEAEEASGEAATEEAEAAGTGEVVAQGARQERGEEIEEILVLARKKSAGEDVQRIPIAVSAYSGVRLEENFVENLTDIGRLAPNVKLSANATGPGTANFGIRGQALFTSIPSDESTVGIFEDGVYLGVNAGALTDLFELGSVEILRGPQGTLFGRNVTGGAINVRTRRPSGEYGVRAKALYGSFDRVDLGLALEGPVSEFLAAKVDLLYKRRDGPFRNRTIPGDPIGDQSTWTVRPLLTFRPTEDFEMTLIGETSEFSGDGTAIRLVRDKTPFATPRPGNRFDLLHDFPARSGYDVDRFTAEMNWDIGPLTVTSITGWRQADVRAQLDVDGTPLSIFHALRGDVDQEQVSTELRVYAPFDEFLDLPFGEAADFTAGVYFFQQDVDYRELRILAGNFDREQSNLDHYAIGVFGQGDYEVFPDVTVTLGGRYTYERKKVDVISFSQSNLERPALPTEQGSDVVVTADGRRVVRRPNVVPHCRPGGVFSDGERWDFASAHAGIRWQALEDVQLYGTYTRSFRSGGFNLRNSCLPAAALEALSPADRQRLSSPGPYDEETVNAGEMGIKAEFLDGQLRSNLAGFINSFSDLQRTLLESATAPGGEAGMSVASAAQRQLNAADALIVGIELELRWLPHFFEGFEFNAAVGWLNADYQRFDSFDLDGDRRPDPEEARRLDFAYVPDWTVHGDASYTFDAPWGAGDGGSFTVRTSYSWSDDKFANDQNSYYLADYGLLDFSVTYTAVEHFQVSLFGKNLLDRPYNDFALDLSFARVDWGIGTPRTWGLELRYEY